MKKILAIMLVLCCATFSLAQTTMPPKPETLNESQLAAYLLSLQPQGMTGGVSKMLVMAPYLPPTLQNSFDALVHGWCENPGFLSCNPAHFPINLTIITGIQNVEWFRVPATAKTLAIPGGLSSHAATVWTLKNTPNQGVWLIMTPKLEDESVIVGALLNGSGNTVQQFKGTGIATGLYKQLLIDTIISQAQRWQP